MQTFPKPIRQSVQRWRASAGFTLIELLTVIAIIGILAAILIPVTGAVRERGRRAVCISNVRQQVLAMQMFAEDNNGDGFWHMRSASNDSAPADLWPDYVDDPDIFVCPSTKNVIRKEFLALGLKWDLSAKAKGGRDDDRGGHSYEYFGFYGNIGPYSGLPESDRKKAPNKVPSDMLTHTVLVVDQDEGSNGGINNCPDATDNHGEDGWTWGFADGHVEWVTRAQTTPKFRQSYHGDTCN